MSHSCDCSQHGQFEIVIAVNHYRALFFKGLQLMANAPVRRMVIFMTGFDPAGTQRYYLMLKKQSRYYTRRFGIPLQVGEFETVDQSKGSFGKTTFNAEWPEGECHVDYRIADWQDTVLAFYDLSFWQITMKYLYWYIANITGGIVHRIMKWQMKFMILFSVPLFLILARVLIVALAGYLFATLFQFLNLSGILGWGLGFLLGGVCCYKLYDFFEGYYETFLIGSIAFVTSLSYRGDEEQLEKSRVFAKEIIEDIKITKPDEVLIIGHSCGCFHSLSLQQALLDYRSENPHKPEILHMTIGSLLPFTLVFGPEKTYKSVLRKLLENKECRWIDYFAPQDPFSVPFFNANNDSSERLTNDLAAQYEVRSAKFRQIFSGKKMDTFKYNPLRLHFQYLAANDILGEYDFFRMISHPGSLKNNLKP